MFYKRETLRKKEIDTVDNCRTESQKWQNGLGEERLP
jgi:hypothetical protein